MSWQQTAQQLGILDPLSASIFAPDEPRRRRRKVQPEITPEQTRTLAGSVMGGLEYGALTLDKPGAAVRGVIHGLTDIAQGETPEWGGGLLNLVPFSDTLKWTDPDERIYGRDLLTNLGAPENKPGLFYSPEDAALDVAGFGLDVMLDPLLLLRGPGAALTAKGLKASRTVAKTDTLADVVKIAEKGVKGKGPGRIMGVTPKAKIDEVLRGERTLAALKVPFMDPFYSFNFGLSPKTAAAVYDKAIYSPLSPVSWWRSRMSKTVAGYDPGVPQAARDAALGELTNLAGTVNQTVTAIAPRLKGLDDIFQGVKQHARLAGDNKGFENATEMLRYISEQKQVVGGKVLEREEIVKMFSAGDPEAINKFAQNAHETLSAMHQIKDTLAVRYQELGGKLTFLDDAYAQHMPRGVSNPKAAKAIDEMLTRKLLPTGTPWSSARKDFFRDIPGGSMPLNQTARHPLITATSRFGDRAVSKTQAAILETPAGNIGRGSVVRALDRDNFGRVLGYNKSTRKVQVCFVNPETGAEATKWLPDYQVQLARPESVKGPLPMPPRDVLTTKDLKAGIKAKLRQYAAEPGFGPAGNKMIDLQTELEFFEVLRPHALRAGIKDGSDAMNWLHRGVKANPDAILDAKKANAAAKHAGEVEPLKLIEGRLPRAADEVLAKDLPSRSRELVEYFRRLPDSVLDTGLFDRTLMHDWMDYSESVAEGIGNLMATHNLFRSTAKLDPADGLITVSEAWRRSVGKVGKGTGKPLLNDQGLQTFAREYAEHLKATDPEGFAKLTSLTKEGMKIEDVVHVPDHIPGVVGQYMDIMQPKTKKWLAKIGDQSMALSKTYLTMWAPAFHVRNLTDGTWRNWARCGSETYSPIDLMRAYKDVFNYLLFGKELPHKDLIESLKVTERKSHRMADLFVPGALEGVDEAVMPRGISELADPLRPSFWVDKATGEKTPWRKRLGPFNVLGVAAEPGSRQNAVIEMGQKGYDLVEFINRTAPFLAAIRSKHAKMPAAAKHLVDQIQFDYSKGVKGSFEQSTMRRIFPFWGFVSNNIPYQFSQLLNHPGGAHAQTLRAMTAGVRGEEGWPSWLRERSPVRLGGPDEEASVLREFGLSIGDLSAFTFKRGLPNIRRTGERFLAQTRSAITFPYKYMAQRDPFTGRKTSEMYSMTGDPHLDTALQASAVSRVASTGRMLLDKRKGWGTKLTDLLTGVKIGTYDLPQGQLYDLQRLQSEMLSGMPDVGSGEFFYPKGETPTPEALSQVSQLNAIKAKLKRLREERAR